MTINEIRLQAANAGSSPLNISGNDLLTILNTIPAPTSGSQWDDVTGGINYAGGDVGINKALPTVALDVVGDVRLDSSNFTVSNSNYSSSLVYAIDTGLVAIGDRAEDINGTRAIIDDSSSEILLSANALISMYSLRYNFLGLQDFATNTAGQATLKIVI